MDGARSFVGFKTGLVYYCLVISVHVMWDYKVIPNPNPMHIQHFFLCIFLRRGAGPRHRLGSVKEYSILWSLP